MTYNIYTAAGNSSSSNFMEITRKVKP